MEKPRISIDLDDVAADYMPTFLKFHNFRHGRNIRFEEIISHNLWEVGFGKNREEVVNYLKEFAESEEFEKIPLIDGARKGIFQLTYLYRPVVLTSRSKLTSTKTEKYCNRNIPTIPVFYSNNGKTKAQVGLELGVIAHLEDHPTYAAECSRAGIRVLLFTRPWNLNFDIANFPNIQRVNSWAEIAEVL